MTTPAQQPPPQQPPAGAEAAMVTAVAVALADASVTSPAVASALLAHQVVTMPDLTEVTLRAALAVVMSFPPGAEGFHGPAGANMARENLMRRAQFAVSAAKRLTSDVRQASGQGTGILSALDAGITRERRYFGQHLMAVWARQRAGARVDTALDAHGRLLGWHTVRDSKTSRECRKADGKNFFADHVPLIGYPGAVHPNCRCEPGAPFPSGAILPSHGLTLRRAA